MSSSSSPFAHLADPSIDHVALEAWSFPSPETRDANLAALPRVNLDRPEAPEIVTFLTSPSGPSDADILRGTTAGSGRADRSFGLVHAAWVDNPPAVADAGWSPTGGRRLPGPSRYRRHDGYRNPDRDLTETSVVVLIEIHFKTPNTGRLAEWADLVITALHSRTGPSDDLLSAQFHLSDDGTRVANLALWTSEADYDQALTTGPPGIAPSPSAQWQAVTDFDGTTRNTITRYTGIAITAH